jgi:hypothetical protein
MTRTTAEYAKAAAIIEATGQTWFYPERMVGEPNSIGTYSIASGVSNSRLLAGYGFGLDIPDWGTAQAIIAQFRKVVTGAGATDHTVQACLAGDLKGNNEASAAGWPGTYDTVEYDGSEGADPMWGLSELLVPADYRDHATLTDGFGIAARVSMQADAIATIDSLYLELTYALPAMHWGAGGSTRSATNRISGGV